MLSENRVYTKPADLFALVKMWLFDSKHRWSFPVAKAVFLFVLNRN